MNPRHLRTSAAHGSSSQQQTPLPRSLLQPLRLTAWLLAGVFCVACLRVSAGSLRTATVGGKSFQVAEGFDLSLAADAKLTLRPVSGSFDDQGNLYITDSSGSNEPPAEQLKNPTHFIRRLRDTDHDGVFDKTEVFADRVMFPQGCLWHGGSVYVAAPPNIIRFTDTDDDGVADRREDWFKGGTLTGCANDIHGPHLGPDGFLYWTKGAFSEQRHERPGRQPIHDSAAHIYRARPDGTGLDVIMSGGMDNPVEVAFSAEGEALFTSTFIDFSQPGWRDGIAHAVYGGVYGKQNGVLEDGRVVRTSPDLLHPFVQFGAGAPSGLCRVVTSGLGDGFQDNLFATTFNLHKITRHVLRPHGATYASTDSDWVVCESMDFHPTDVLEDADGSLLIVDTGGWYKLCCPTSQLAKPDVLGAVYRLRRSGSGRLTGAAREAAYRRLAEPPPMRGNAEWVELKRKAIEANPSSATAFRSALSSHLSSPEASRSLPIIRVALEGLGRIQHQPSVPLILESAAKLGHSDPFLSHSLILALIEIGDAAALRAAIPSPVPAVQRAALVALDQLKDGDLSSKVVIPLLASSDSEVRRIASWVCRRHPDWAQDLAGYFHARLLRAGPGHADSDNLAAQLAQFARSPVVSDLLVSTLATGQSNQSGALPIVLRAMAESGVSETPTAWADAIIKVIQGRELQLAQQAIGTLRRLPALKSAGETMRNALIEAAMSRRLPAISRLQALSSVPGGIHPVPNELFDQLRAHLIPSEPVEVRNAAAAVVAAAQMSSRQLRSLLETVKIVGPLELPQLLAAYEKDSSEDLGNALLEALRISKSAGSLRAEMLKPRLKKYPETVQRRADELLSSLHVDAAAQKSRLETILTEVVGKGDVRRGQAIFNSAKAACISCHAMGYAGGKFGPDLTRIGEVRSERDLLEAIVYPSSSFVRSFEPILVVTRDGEQHAGILRSEAPEEIVLGTGPAQDLRIARSEVTDMRPGTVSVMPQGLEEQITRQELADLVAFLKNTRWGAR